MSVLVKTDTPVLHKPAKPVVANRASGIIRKLRRIMREVNWGNCVGMAAPQIGINKRVFVAENKAFINPKIVWRSLEKDSAMEGCYSLEHGAYYPIKRSKSVRIQWVGARGQHHIATFTGNMARVIQHEYDHIDGILINEKGAKHETKQVR